MPTYAYRCRDCGHQFDIFQKFSEDALTECPVCVGSIRRVIQPTGVVFRGTGFYINDSRPSGKDDGSKGRKEDGGDPAKEKPAAKADSGESGGKDSPDKTTGKSGEKTNEKAAEKTSAPKKTPAAASR